MLASLRALPVGDIAVPTIRVRAVKDLPSHSGRLHATAGTEGLVVARSAVGFIVAFGDRGDEATTRQVIDSGSLRAEDEIELC